MLVQADEGMRPSSFRVRSGSRTLIVGRSRPGVTRFQRLSKNDQHVRGLGMISKT